MKIWSNLHTHSNFSDGKNTPREVVEAAVESGFQVIGFSDHGYTDFDYTYCMHGERLANYMPTIRALQAEYADRIRVLCGVEHDYFGPKSAYEGYDYFIGSVHYVIGKGIYYPIDESAAKTQACIDEGFGGDTIAFCRDYYESVVNCAKLKPLYLGHFDLITKHDVPDETDKRYIDIALQAMDAVLETGVPIEVNTGAIARGVKKLPYPSDFLMRRIAEKNGTVTLGSDCHDCTKLDCCFDMSLELLRNSGIRSVLDYDGEKFVERGI